MKKTSTGVNVQHLCTQVLTNGQTKKDLRRNQWKTLELWNFLQNLFAKLSFKISCISLLVYLLVYYQSFTYQLNSQFNNYHTKYLILYTLIPRRWRRLQLYWILLHNLSFKTLYLIYLIQEQKKIKDKTLTFQ